MGPLGWQETVFIFVLALLLFGPKKLPELGKNIGKALTEFRRASNELKSTFDREMSNLERETESLKAETSKVHSEIQSSVYDGSSYDYNYYDSGYDGYQPYDNSSGTSTSTDSASAVPGADTEPAATATAASGPNGVPGTVAVGQPTEAAKPDAAPSATAEEPRQSAD